MMTYVQIVLIRNRDPQGLKPLTDKIVSHLGQLLSEVADVSAKGAGLTPLPAQEARVQHGEEKQGHGGGMNQASRCFF
jgi:hypothetical protein